MSCFQKDGWVVIKEDVSSAIIMAKDSYKSIAVQVLWNNNSTTADAQGNLQVNNHLFCVHSSSVFTFYKDSSGHIVNNPSFKEELATTIVKVKKIYDEILSYSAVIDGSLVDYRDQNKELNKKG